MNGNGSGAQVGELTREARDVSGLAQAFQQMAEMARVLKEKAESAAVAWYAKGAQDSLELCAERIREVIKPTVRSGPVHQTNAMLDAFRACLAMLEGISAEVESSAEVRESEQEVDDATGSEIN